LLEAYVEARIGSNPRADRLNLREAKNKLHCFASKALTYQAEHIPIMPYPEALVQPMRAELTRLGVEELTTADAVDAAFAQAEEAETMLLIVNSVCGCAAGMARPAVGLARQHGVQPDRYVTVFAGQDLEATVRAREYLAGIPPSSPFMALFKGGDPVYIIERRHIEGRSASAIAADLVGAYDKFCGTDATAEDGPESPHLEWSGFGNGLSPTFRSIR